MKDKYIDQYGIDSLPHLKECSAKGIEIFCTINEEMLKDRVELEKEFNVKIKTPKEIMEESFDENKCYCPDLDGEYECNYCKNRREK